MKITLLTVGKPRNSLFRDGTLLYLERIRNFFSVEWITVPDSLQKKDQARIRSSEGELILKRIRERDRLVLLDEKGAQFTSPDFSKWFERTMEETRGRMIFVIGGPYGVSTPVRQRADDTISLSRMTFPHDLCVVFLAEQIYRACTIRAGTGYHH
jgi:23S rRNA (pseudouridine1915-N3)-methyltransferase